MRGKRVRKGMVGAVLLAAATATAAFGQETGDRDNGRRLFMADGCYACHGTTGHGGGAAGPQLTPGPIPLPAMIAQLRHPNRMPAYSPAVVSDAEIADIHAYLASVPPGRPAEQIPLLDSLK
jgi:mono/diheme cytochrome c family protein